MKAFSDTGQPFITSQYVIVPWDGAQSKVRFVLPN